MNEFFKCIIVDDEPMASALLVKHLGYLFPNIEVLDIFSSWETALPALRGRLFDLLFLDVSMPGKTGLELLNLLPDLDAEIIFITAHSEHALSAFKFTPSGYVLKPIDDELLTHAINKATERILNKRLAKQNIANALATKIGIPDKKGTEYVSIKEIIFLEGLKGGTRVVSSEGEVTTSYAIGRFLVPLEPHGFFQVHRSFIINVNHIKRYTNEGGIVMSNGDSIPLARNLKDDFLLMFQKISKAEI